MITNDWIQGYLAALRTVENGVLSIESALETYENTYDPDISDDKLPQDIVEEVIVFIRNQRRAYKELVEKLNKEHEKK